MLWTLFDHGCLNPNLLNAVSQAGAHWISLWGQRLDSFVNWMYDLPLSQNWKYLGVRFSPLHLLTPNAVSAHRLFFDCWCCVYVCYDCFSAFLWMTCMLVQATQATAQNTHSMWYLCTDVLGVHCYAWLKSWTGSPLSIWVLIKVHMRVYVIYHFITGLWELLISHSI